MRDPQFGESEVSLASQAKETLANYELALEELNALDADLSDPNHVLEVTSRLGKILNGFHDSRCPNMQQIVERIRSENMPASAELWGVVERAKAVMQELLKKIDLLSQAASTCRERLAPGVDQTVLQHRAVSAYGRYGGT